MSAPRLRIEEIALAERPVRLRLPFRYGAVTLREATEAWVTVRVRDEDGRTASGQAAELMAPKWFDKSPELSDAQNADQLRLSLCLARRRYLGARVAMTAFEHHAAHEADHRAEAAEAGLNGLVAGFGTAQVDKAVIDALGALHGASFFGAARANLFGLTSRTAPDLAKVDLGLFLRDLAPRRSILVRHTVGALDALTEAEIPPSERVGDGLPESLEAAVAAHGLRAFKIKLSGRIEADLDRLHAVAAVLDRAPAPYVATLDGNEQFEDAEALAAFWAALARKPCLERLRRSVTFVEQPLPRAVALARDLGAIGCAVRIEIDESDDGPDAFLRARALGYTGVSSKSCKGPYRALLNRARVAAWNEEAGARRFFVSAEDLSTQPGPALEQDLALAALLGCETVERNGHHYGDGRTGLPEARRRFMLERHPTLYGRHGGAIGLRISAGEIDLSSIGMSGGMVPLPSTQNI